MRYVRIGLSGVFAPTDSQIDHILAVLEDSANAPVFVHCRRGADPVRCGHRLLPHHTRLE